MHNQEAQEGELRAELELRIAILESTDEAAFGKFTRFDWVLLLLFGVVLPVILVVVAR